MTPGAAPSALEVRRGEPRWPERLEHLQQPPEQLWVRGTLPPAGAPAVAVVGSRRASPGGLLTAGELGRDLALANVVVVSGLARGIDGAAHRGALSGSGRTVAVLGCGVEVCYPAEHRQLRDEIAESGAVVSEDPGEAPPDGWRFPRRNRLIAALAEAVVVVEASDQSGALSTARWAADLGREVLAVPGSVRSPTSRGTNLLIRDGVRPFLGLEDLFESVPALQRGMAAAAPAPPSADDPDDPASACQLAEDPLLRAVLDRLGADPLHPDSLAADLGVPAGHVAVALTTLQLRGAVRRLPGGLMAAACASAGSRRSRAIDGPRPGPFGPAGLGYAEVGPSKDR